MFLLITYKFFVRKFAGIPFFISMHSMLRWVVLLSLIYAIFRAYEAKKNQMEFMPADNQASLVAMIACDLQLLIGGYLYYFGNLGWDNIKNNGMAFVMSNQVSRFFAVEHVSMMLVALVLVHIGRARSKRATTDRDKHHAVFVFYSIALALILISIPWPFREIFANRSWF